MRARNREINIFNMSLLDILTGMLGAFLFLMLGLLPYYSRVSKEKPEDVQALKQENQTLRDQVERQQQQIADLQKQLEELQKIVKQAAGGPLTAEQIQQLMDQLNEAHRQIDQLRAQLQQSQEQLTQAQQQVSQLQQQMQQAKQDLDDMTKDRDFWRNQQGYVGVTSQWDSVKTDIDVFVISPSGKRIFSPKPGKLLGVDLVYTGDDSHADPKNPFNNEGVIFYTEEDGDYLVVYRVPKDADPSTYVNLRGSMMYFEMTPDRVVHSRADVLRFSHADQAAPGGLYAWSVIHYDPAKKLAYMKPDLPAKLPPGVILPSQSTMPTSIPSPASSSTVTPGLTATPTTTPVRPVQTPPQRPVFPFNRPGAPGGGLPQTPARPGMPAAPPQPQASAH